MKCKSCNGCLRVVRVGENESQIFWYCPLCRKIFEFTGNRSLVKNDELLKQAEIVYKEQYGTTL